jgi:hypothetical protein
VNSRGPKKVAAYFANCKLIEVGDPDAAKTKIFFIVFLVYSSGCYANSLGGYY